MKPSVETTQALSLPGVIARLLWAAFLEKIISGKAAKGGGPSQKKRHIDKLEKSRIITF
jgi:hypothetical protein